MTVSHVAIEALPDFKARIQRESVTCREALSKGSRFSSSESLGSLIQP